MEGGFLSQRLCCSLQDRLECMETVRQLALLADRVSRQGKAALTEQQAGESVFLRACLDAAAELEERAALRTVLEGFLLADDCRGKEFLRRLVIVHGVLLIRDGLDGRALGLRLQGWFGAELADRYREELSRPDRESAGERSVYPDFDILASTSMSYLVRLTFDVDAATLAVALLGASRETREVFMNAISTNERRQAVLRLMAEKKNSRTGDMVAAQRWICDYSSRSLDDCPEF